MSTVENERFKEIIENHFPITVLSRQYKNTEALNKTLHAWIMKMVEKHSDSPENAALDPEIATHGGYQTSKKMNIFQLDEPSIKELRDKYILPAVHHYMRAVFSEQAKKIEPNIIGWSNVLGPSDWQGPHMHPTESNLVSGVYYIHVPDYTPPEGCIEFLNPHPISQHHGFSPSRRIEPHEGQLLIFPPFYTHYVHPLKNGKNRTIIAFDVLARSNKLNFVF